MNSKFSQIFSFLIFFLNLLVLNSVARSKTFYYFEQTVSLSWFLAYSDNVIFYTSQFNKKCDQIHDDIAKTLFQL